MKVDIYVNVYKCKSIHLNICMYICIYIYMYMYVYTYICKSIYIYMCKYMYICKYIYIYIHMKKKYMFIQGDPKFFLGTPRRLPSEGPGDGFTEMGMKYADPFPSN